MNLRHVPNRISEWWRRRSGTEALEISFQGVIALATLTYVTVALFQWSAMRRANQIALNALVSGDRPWMGVATIGELKDYEVGSTPTAEIKIENFGKSPAIRVRAKSGMGTYTPNTFVFHDVISNPILTERAIGTIFPNHGATSTVGMWIPLKQWQKEPRTELIIVGLITYEDRLGNVHHTPICQRYQPPTIFNGRTIVEAGFVQSGSCASDPTIPKID